MTDLNQKAYERRLGTYSEDAMHLHEDLCGLMQSNELPFVICYTLIGPSDNEDNPQNLGIQIISEFNNGPSYYYTSIYNLDGSLQIHHTPIDSDRAGAAEGIMDNIFGPKLQIALRASEIFDLKHKENVTTDIILGALANILNNEVFIKETQAHRHQIKTLVEKLIRRAKKER